MFNNLKFLGVLLQLLIIEFENTLDSEHVLLWIDNSSNISWIRKQARSDNFAFWMHRFLDAILLRDYFNYGTNILQGN